MKPADQKEIPGIPPERPVQPPQPSPAKPPETPVMPPEISPKPDLPTTQPLPPENVTASPVNFF